MAIDIRVVKAELERVGVGTSQNGVTDISFIEMSGEKIQNVLAMPEVLSVLVPGDVSEILLFGRYIAAVRTKDDRVYGDFSGSMPNGAVALAGVVVILVIPTVTIPLIPVAFWIAFRRRSKRRAAAEAFRTGALA